VPALRTQQSADLVALLVQNAGNPPEICGIANRILRFGGTGDPSAAFSVVGVNCATTDHTFTHELGHNMGGWHSWAEPGSGTPHAWAIFDRAFGFANQAGAFRTIMNNETLTTPNDVCDTFGDGCPRLNRWSSGRFSGNQQAWINGAWRDLGNRGVLDDGLNNDDQPTDMAQVLEEITPTIAVYRNASGSAPASPAFITASPICHGLNEVQWAAVAGAGWYELQDIWGGLYIAAALRPHS
jgi:hypothetical protein